MSCALALWLGASANTAQGQVVTRLIAGNNIEVGTVTALVDDGLTGLFVLIETKPGWNIDIAHVAVADSVENMPINSGGNPRIGQFPVHVSGGSGVTVMEILVPLNGLVDPSATEVCMAIHTVVERRSLLGKLLQQETAWADGERVGDKGWSTYFCISKDGAMGGDDPPGPIPGGDN
jgi:hypothetical protein